MNRFRPLRRLLASALGVLLLQAFLAPGDLACALRHHGKAAGVAGTQSAPSHARPGSGAHDPAHDPAAMHAAHDAGLPVASHDSGPGVPSSGDHCGDPSRNHCAWMSACAPVAVMTPASSFAPERPIARLAPAPAAPRLPAAVALLPEVPPPRG